MAEPSSKVRIDKWLWAVRIFKSRTIASEVVKQGHVKLDGKTLKPSSTVGPGQVLRVRRNGYDMQYEVLQVIERRVGAPIAVTCYRDTTPAEELSKFDAWPSGGAPAGLRERGTGRPTKRERRDIDEFRAAEPGYDWGWVDTEESEEDH